MKANRKPMQLDEALRHAVDGHSILFVGSGFSFGVRSESGDPLPTGQQLSDLLAQELRLDERPPPDQTAELFQEARGTHGLIQFLRPRLTVKEPNPEQRAFARVPWRRIRARHDAEGSLRDHGEQDAADALPAACPYTLDQITGDWLP